ncbi:hypothetical protein CWE11_11145 [Aliidiomarina sanyensis]|uniref:Uncharacterized protein n=1 Tax=Aliidiomarina sanyensis TaxID=1249555 RepID=A0A432WBA9_9GAMM|nr:hypothetical protein CWE11_11145 [Aliidiomarina sanyensis]
MDFISYSLDVLALAVIALNLYLAAGLFKGNRKLSLLVLSLLVFNFAVNYSMLEFSHRMNPYSFLFICTSWILSILLFREVENRKRYVILGLPVLLGLIYVINLVESRLEGGRFLLSWLVL